MNFDFSWFLTIPGMLITGGVLLLLIALIIFIATTGKRGKKGEREIVGKPVAVTNQPVMENPQVIEQVPTMSPMQQAPMMADGQIPVMQNMYGQTNAFPEMGTPAVSPMTNINTMPGSMSNNIMDPIPNNMMDPMSNSMVDPFMVSGVNSDPMMVPTPEASFALDGGQIPSNPIGMAPEPIVEPIQVQPEMNNEIAMPTVEVIPDMEQPTIIDTPIVVGAQPINTQSNVTIYGGADPTISNIVIDDQGEHKIYGGADPLEGTQAIPIIQNQIPLVDPIPTEIETPMASVEPVAVEPQPIETVQTINPVEGYQATPIVDQNPIETVPIQPSIFTEPVAPEPQPFASTQTVPTVDMSSVTPVTEPVQPVIPQMQEPVTPVFDSYQYQTAESGMQQPMQSVTPQIVPEQFTTNINEPLQPVAPTAINSEPVQTYPKIETLN